MLRFSSFNLQLHGAKKEEQAALSPTELKSGYEELLRRHAHIIWLLLVFICERHMW